jgi:hypothetical protein
MVTIIRHADSYSNASICFASNDNSFEANLARALQRGNVNAMTGLATAWLIFELVGHHAVSEGMICAYKQILEKNNAPPDLISKFLNS